MVDMRVLTVIFNLQSWKMHKGFAERLQAENEKLQVGWITKKNMNDEIIHSLSSYHNQSW